jgi:hypothetical protein
MAPSWSCSGRFGCGALDGDAQLSQVDGGLWAGLQTAVVMANWIAQDSDQHCGR